MSSSISTSLRPRYRCSRKFHPLLFPVLAVLPILTATGAAALLYWLYTLGFYFFVFVPLIVTLIPAGLVMLAVRVGHCRNPWLACLIGLVAGLLIYLGYYYVGLLVNGIVDVRVLPDYIVWRVNTDVIEDPTMPSTHQTNGLVDVIFKWIFFAFDAAICVILPTLAGWVWSRKPFCEGCGRWMKQRLICLPRGSGREVARQLSEGSVRLVADAEDTPYGTLPHAAVAVEYCDRTGACPIYLSVKEIRQGGSGPASRFDGALGKSLLRRVELTTEEIADLVLGKPDLASAIGASPGDVQRERARMIPHAQDTPTVDPLRAGIEVVGLSPPDGRTILTKKHVWISVFLALLDIVLLLGSIAVFVSGGLLMAAALDTVNTPGWEHWLIPGVVIGLLGLAGAIFTAYRGLSYPLLFGRRYMWRLARREIGLRDERWVDPDDAAACFVHVVPRERWSKLCIEDATDIGFIKADKITGEWLFEGDTQRCRIPADPGAGLSIEQCVSNLGQHNSVTYFVVIKPFDIDRPGWELCLSDRHPSGKYNQSVRFQRAARLAEKLSVVLPDKQA